MNDDEKTCPFCAETIKAAAVVCKHCGRDLAGPALPADADPKLMAQHGITYVEDRYVWRGNTFKRLEDAASYARSNPHVAGLAGSPGAGGSPIPVTIVAPKSFKWWLWVPLGLLGAFFLYGALIPEHVAKANATRRACEKMAGGVSHLQYECGRIYDRMIREGETKGRREGCPPEHPDCSWGK